MRDGTAIAVDVYLPPEKARCPALFSMSPYGKEKQSFPGGIFTFVEAGDIEYFTSRGYAYVIADSRGSAPSGGRWDLFDRREQLDGYDLIEWTARQPWCDGQVAMIGESYFGLIQYLVAATRPPSLKTIVPFDAMTDLYRDFCYHGGLFNLGFIPMWLSMVYERCLPESGQARPDGWRAPANALLAIHRHPTDGPFYRERSACTRFDRIRVPVFHIACASQYIHYRGHLQAYASIDTPRKLFVGTGSPWAFFHSQALAGEIGRWLDHWLKGKDTGIMREPQVTMYVSGANEWRWEDVYPLARTKWTKYYLHSGPGRAASEPPHGSLNGTAPAGEDPDSYKFPESQRVVEANQPVLGYLTAPLKEDTDIIGPASLVLHGATTVDDASWVVKIDDVAPDGSFTVAGKGWLKASHRELDEARSLPGRPYHTHANPTPVEPNRVYRYDIEIWPIFRTFKAGHRIRLRIASSDSRTWDSNNFHLPVELPATISVYHDSRHPSHLILPVAPRSSGAGGRRATFAYEPAPLVIGARGSWKS